MSPPKRRPYVPAVGPKLKRLLAVVFVLFALLGINALYLATITFLEWRSGETYQNYFYQWMFLGHLVLGLLITLPVVVFGIVHIKNAHDRPNRRAVRVGYALFAAALVLLATGFVLMRVEGFEVRDPRARSVAYWAHVIAPVACVWLFVLHRLAGPRIRWRVGLSYGVVAVGFAALMAGLHQQDPRSWNRVGPASGERYFFPSLARTATGDFIAADVLANDAYCAECHPTAHAGWSNSVHRFSSFNNPAYLFSVRETRQVALERDGDVQASRFCAGCHDPVPFFSGAFDDPNFDDVADPTAHAGITCTVCHAITHVNSRRGNSDFTIEEPAHYPFAFSDHPVLAWINRQLVKAKPSFHQKTFLKPLHRTDEFCGACHKVHLPVELNDYKWLRGQNHLDSYHLSGVSGHGAQSFYYPETAETNCNGCHMPLAALDPDADDFGARDFDGDGELELHDHLFPSANTAIPFLLSLGQDVIDEHRAFNAGVMRVDLFGLRAGGRVDGELIELPDASGTDVALEPEADYLLEVVVRTVKLGHHFTQGTSDSNEIWLEVELLDAGGDVLATSGAQAPDGDVDPDAHFVNSFVLDRDGRRIDRRNAQDIFVPLYNHQIPPGAADVIHYGFRTPADTSVAGARVRLLYRKFDTAYLRRFEGEAFDRNDLPVLVLAEDEVAFAAGTPRDRDATPIPEWQRWNDFGIGLLRKGDFGSNRGELREAERAFQRVEELGRPDGPLNLARVYFKEGRLDDAVSALERAADFDPPAPPWIVLWFSGLVNKQNGFLDEAIADFEALATMDTEQTRRRNFDFGQDWRVLNQLGQTLVERSRLERGDAGRPERERILRAARGWFERTLALDPENQEAHYNLGLVCEELGDGACAEHHRAEHERYRPDDNARDAAIASARRAYPAADRAAEAVVIYPLD